MKRCVCCILVAIIIFVNCGIVSFAADNEKGIPIPYTLSDSIDYDTVSLPGLSGDMPVYYYDYVNGKPNWTAYSLLDDCQKKMFDYIVNAPLGTLKIDMTFEKGEFLYSNFVKEYLWEVMYAVCNDRPDVFYYNGYSIEGYLYDNTSIKSLEYTITPYAAAGYTATNIPGCHSAMVDKMVNIPVDVSNRYNFVKSLHDFLCETVYYPDVNSSDYVGTAHDAYGALVEGRAVCQGYAEAFKMVCDYYKVPCVTVTGIGNGGPHMWNAVQMDDGLWYLIDATWNDQTEKPAAQIFYDFFLVGTNTKDIYFGGNAFSETHIADTDMFLPVLKYAAEKYTQTNHFTEFNATFNSYAIDTDKILVRSFYDMADSYVYYHGMYVDVNTAATNATVTVPSGSDGADENWTLALIGDCNGDAAADASDYAYAVNRVISDSQIDSVYDVAADAFCDGYLDVVDLAILERAISGKNTEIKIEY